MRDYLQRPQSSETSPAGSLVRKSIHLVITLPEAHSEDHLIETDHSEVEIIYKM